jgi:hypothetical protein
MRHEAIDDDGDRNAHKDEGANDRVLVREQRPDHEVQDCEGGKDRDPDHQRELVFVGRPELCGRVMVGRIG